MDLLDDLGRPLVRRAFWLWDTGTFEIRFVEADRLADAKGSTWRVPGSGFFTIGETLFDSESDAVAAAERQIAVMEQRARTARIKIESIKLRRSSGMAAF